MTDRYRYLGRTERPNLSTTVMLYECPDCGSAVSDRDKHDDFHKDLDTVSGNAWWGGLMRPLG